MPFIIGFAIYTAIGTKLIIKDFFLKYKNFLKFLNK